MSTTNLNWKGAGYYAGVMSGNDCEVSFVASASTTEVEASEIARQTGRGTISLIPDLVRAYKYADWVKIDGEWVKAPANS